MGDVYDMGEGNEDEEEEGEMVQMPFIAELKKGDKTLRFRCTATDTVIIDSVEFIKKNSDVSPLSLCPLFLKMHLQIKTTLQVSTIKKTNLKTS
jgi:hypothetical protein